MARAAGLAENLLHDYHDQLRAVTVAPGETGSFEVFLNRKKIFSKSATDRFPEVNEIEEKIGELVGA
ncbi:MAG: Rdx family protein [Chloroflexi bacterium]|nr:Rdx family protein [Chloroflexota bacterium]